MFLAAGLDSSSADATFVASPSTTGTIASTVGTKPSTVTASTVTAFTVGCTTADDASAAADLADVSAEMRKSSICMDSCEKPPCGICRAGKAAVELLDAFDYTIAMDETDVLVISKKKTYSIRVPGGQCIQAAHLPATPRREALNGKFRNLDMNRT